MDNQESYIESLFVTYHDALKYFCMYCFSYQPQFLPYVDDCIQDVFVAAFKKREKLVKHPNPYAWLLNACRKQCYSVMRRQKIWNKAIGKVSSYQFEQTSIMNVENDIVRWMCSFDAEKWIDSLKSSLTSSESMIFTEYFEKSKTAPQIAKEQEISEASVRGAIQRVRKKALSSKMIIFFLLQFGLWVWCSI